MKKSSHEASNLSLSEIFKEALSAIKPIFRIRNEQDYESFVFGEKSHVMRDKLVKAFPDLGAQQRLDFFLDARNMLEQVRSEQYVPFSHCEEKAVSRPLKVITAHEWDGLKTGLRQSLKSVAKALALSYVEWKAEAAPQPQAQPQEAPAGLIYVI